MDYVWHVSDRRSGGGDRIGEEVVVVVRALDDELAALQPLDDPTTPNSSLV